MGQRRAYMYAVTAVLLWSTVASAFKLTLRYIGPMEMLYFSSAVSFATLFVILMVQGKLDSALTCTRREYVNSAILGFLNPFLYYVILFKAYDLLQAQAAQPLNYTWSIVLVLLSIPILKQRISRASIIAILISYVGVLVLATRGDLIGLSFTDPFGVALALSTTIIWALFWIYNMKDERDPVVKLFLAFAFGFAYIFIATIAVSGISVGNPIGIVGAIYIGIFEMGITFVIWLKALTFSRTTANVSILIYISPFISFILIHLLVGETILASSMAGLVLIVAGVVIQNRIDRHEVSEDKEGKPRGRAGR